MFNLSRENTSFLAKWWRNVDKQILFLFTFLLLLGLFFSFSSTTSVMSEKLNKQTYFFFKENSNKTSNYLNNLNSQINNELKSTNTLRLGGEYIIGLFSIRAGLSNEDSFQNKITVNNSSASWGVGINFKRSSCDIAFIDYKNKNSYNIFPVVLTDKYYVTNNKSQIIFTYNLKL